MVFRRLLAVFVGDSKRTPPTVSKKGDTATRHPPATELGRDKSGPRDHLYYLEPRSWDGDDGLYGRGYNLFHSSDPARSLRWHDLRPQGKSWRSTFFLTKIAGVSHRADVAQRPEFDVGARISLVPDPDNPHSRSGKAVQVWDARQTQQVGFVPDDDAPRIFDRLRKGDPVWGFVFAEHRKNGERVGLEILLVPPDSSLKLPPELGNQE